MGLVIVVALAGCGGVGYYGEAGYYGPDYGDYYYGPAYYGGVWGPDVYVFGHGHEHHEHFEHDFGRRGWASRSAGHAFHGGGFSHGGGYHGGYGGHGGHGGH